MAAPASAPGWRLFMGCIGARSIATCPLRRTAVVEIRLDIEHAELSVLLLAVRSHSPEIRDAMSGDGNVRVISARHQDGVALSHDGDQLVLLLGVTEILRPKRRLVFRTTIFSTTGCSCMFMGCSSSFFKPIAFLR
jgi:hypothetical protein